MDSSRPILRLYSDAWTHIVFFLDLRHIYNLTLLGNPTLTYNVTRSVRNACQANIAPLLDVEALFHFCRQLTSLESATFKHSVSGCVVKRPMAPLKLPSTLTFLDLNFSPVIHLIQPIKLSETVPGLLSLRLSCARISAEHQLADFDLPKSLRELSIISKTHMSQITLTSEAIASLPRGLTSLSLSWGSIGKDVPNPDNGITSYEWPLSLSSCTLTSFSSIIKIEHLPRTVSCLNLFQQDVETSFGLDLSEFPWRAFFPRLTTLYLTETADPDYSRLLHAILMKSTFDSQDTESFIASSFWSLPSLFDPSTNVFPALEFLRLPSGFWDYENDAHSEELAPYLKLLMLAIIDASADTVKRFKGASEAFYNEPTSMSYPPLPSSVKILYGATVNVNLLNASLSALRCTNICGKYPGQLYRFNQGDLPENLQSLSLSYHAGTLLPFLPTSLMSCTLPLRSNDQWDLVVSRLVFLRELIVTVDGQWDWHEPLHPIASSSFDTLHFSPENAPPADIPMLRQLFPPKESLHPPVLPPSLTTLHILGGAHDLSLLAMIPHQVRSLVIDQLAWNLPNANIVPFPEASELSPVELMRSLPRNLRSLNLATHGSLPKGSRLDAAEMLGELPRSLLSFTDQGVLFVNKVLDGTWDGKLQRLIELAPPLLLRCNVAGGLELTRNHHPYLNSYQ